ncbi:MAG: hypothetical protein AAF366_04265 [Pseudomonadota bacterium]
MIGGKTKASSALPPAFQGYPEWERLTRPGEDMMLMLFVELVRVDGVATLADAIDETLRRAEDHDIVMLNEEQVGLEAERAALKQQAADFPWSVYLSAFVSADLPVSDYPKCWRILHVGPRVRPSRFPTPSMPTDAPARPGGRTDPILGLIDDQIGYLHKRFRKAPMATRIEAIWLQSYVEVGEATDDPIRIGQVLSRTVIDADLRSGRPEQQIYRARDIPARTRENAVLMGRGRRLSQMTSHGTHVLDLFAGDDFEAVDAPLAHLPIFAAQLPRSAIADTSGRSLEAYLAIALRWMSTRAATLPNGGPCRPLIVNLSLGALGGPGDETAFLARWFQQEVERYARLTAGARMQIVAAHGNARLERLVAKQTTPLSVEWRVQPDDRTDSYVELRIPADRHGDVRLSITPPPGPLSAISGPWPKPGSVAPKTKTDRVHALFGLQDEACDDGTPGAAVALLALGPTARSDGGATAPAGAWTLLVETTSDAPVPVTAKILRDDTPPGFALHGRQSSFNSPADWDPDPQTGNLDLPRPGNPVTRSDTAVNYAGAATPNLWLIGAARNLAGRPDQVEPAPYSAESDHGPTMSALAEDGRFLRGLRAAGRLSGAQARVSGTSAAAPVVARQLALHLMAGKTDPAAEDDLVDLVLETCGPPGLPTTPDGRLGRGVVSRRP